MTLNCRCALDTRDFQSPHANLGELRFIYYLWQERIYGGGLRLSLPFGGEKSFFVLIFNVKKFIGLLHFDSKFSNTFENVHLKCAPLQISKYAIELWKM